MNTSVVAGFIANSIDKKFIDGGPYQVVADTPVSGDDTLIRVMFMGQVYMVRVIPPEPAIKIVEATDARAGFSGERDRGIEADAGGSSAGADQS